MVNIKDTHDLFAQLEREHDYVLEAPVDVDLIAEMLGLRVRYDFDLESDGITGAIFLNEDDAAEILINPVENSYEPRRRFTLAHEIGHYCLHLNDTKRGFIDDRKSMSRSNTYWDKYEGEANSFAANLLMPKSLVLVVGREVVKEKGGNGKIDKELFIEELSARFQVSIPALKYRLQALGIIKS